MTSFNWRGTSAVLMAVSMAVIAQFVFNYLAVINDLFESRPLALMDGLLLMGVGILMMMLEIEKVLLRRGGHLST